MARLDRAAHVANRCVTEPCTTCGATPATRQFRDGRATTEFGCVEHARIAGGVRPPLAPDTKVSGWYYGRPFSGSVRVDRGDVVEVWVNPRFNGRAFIEVPRYERACAVRSREEG